MLRFIISILLVSGALSTSDTHSCGNVKLDTAFAPRKIIRKFPRHGKGDPLTLLYKTSMEFALFHSLIAEFETMAEPTSP